MNSNNKRNKSRSTIGAHNNSSNAQNINSKPQMRQKSERVVTPEGVYFNGRVMHCTTSLIGCVVHIEVKDGTKYEGVLRTFSPDFELVIDYVTKVEPNVIPIVGTNIGTLLASLQANNRVSPTLIFKFADVVKLNAINVDLDFATTKGHMLTDTEISRFDTRQLNRDKELVPWEGSADCGDLLEQLDEHNGVNAQNGWDPDDMFKTNELKFKVRSTYDPNLKDYTVALVKGEGEDYEQKQREAEKIANEIECDTVRTERYSKEDADDEERFSAVVRPTDTFQHNRHQRSRKPNNSQTNNNYNANNASSTGSRSNRTSVSSTAPTVASPPFHSNKNANTYSKQQFSNSSANTCATYQSSTQTQLHKQSYREDSYANQLYSKADNEEPQTPPTTPQTPPTTQTAHYAAPPQNPLPQRGVNENRRALVSNKRKEEVAADLKKFSNDFKLPSNQLHPNETNTALSTASALSTKETKSDSLINNNKNSSISVNVNNSNNKSKPEVESTPVKDKPETSTADCRESDKDLQMSGITGTASVAGDKTVNSVTPVSPNFGGDSEIAKKSTLNPEAKVFTPRSPLTQLNTSTTPPSVASTPSSTVSQPMTGPLTHQSLHSLNHSHSQSQVGQSMGGQQSGGHAPQPRFQNPLMQIQPQYNVLTPGLTLPLGPNQYLMTNVTAMTPTFAQSNPNQQRNYRSKGPQQYTNHGVRHDYTQPSAHVAAAVTGHPVLATAPIAAPQQIPVSYGPQQTATMVTPQGPPQHMYQHMYTGFHPRMNVLPQHSGMGMAVPHVQYDPTTQLQHIYATAGTVQLQHLVSQAHQHMTNSGPSTPQSGTPTTPLHGGPAPSPVHHQPNQPPTPTPQQTVMYANVASPHNPQNPNVGHHSSSGAPYPNIVILPTGQAVGGHHAGGHGGPLHAAHALSHSSTPGNHHGGPPPAILPVQLIASSNAAQNALAASFNANAGV